MFGSSEARDYSDLLDQQGGYKQGLSRDYSDPSLPISLSMAKGGVC